MVWMSWRPEIPDPETFWEEFDRRMDEQKDEAILRRCGLRERPSPPPNLNVTRRTKKGDPNVKLVYQ